MYCKLTTWRHDPVINRKITNNSFESCIELMLPVIGVKFANALGLKHPLKNLMGVED